MLVYNLLIYIGFRIYELYQFLENTSDYDYSLDFNYATGVEY